MERRNFLKGVFGGVTAGGILLRTPEPETFAGILAPETPLIVAPNDYFAGVDLGHILFNQDGKPVAVITEIATEMSRVDMNRAGDNWTTFAPGYPTVTIRAVCRGPVKLAVR